MRLGKDAIAINLFSGDGFMMRVITGQSGEMDEAAREEAYTRQLAFMKEQSDVPPFIQAQNDEAFLEMELMGSFNGGDWFGRMEALFDDPNSDRSSFDTVCDSFDRVHWRQYLKTALQETKRTDGLNFRRIRMLQNILSRA